MRRAPWLIAAVVAVSASPWTGAQPARFSDATRLDEGVADRSPLSTSLRRAGPTLRLESGFDSVFELGGPAGRVLARFDGGLSALFPRSIYDTTPFGELPRVPAGTQFVIGEPPAWLLEQFGLAGPTPEPRVVAASPLLLPAKRMDRRAGAAARDVDTTAVAARTDRGARDEPSVRLLLLRAAAAERARMRQGSAGEMANDS